MKATKLLLGGLVLALSATSASAYTEVKCDVDPSYAANSCNQCFDGGAKGEGDNLGLLKDTWINNSETDKILFKEEQEYPKMVNLDSGSVTWKENPGSAGFWEYTSEFQKIYNADEEGYVLKKGGSVVWLKSKLGYAYSLEKNKAEAGKNIGMLVYPLSTHNISADNNINPDSTLHRECVLFKSGTPTPKEVVNTGTPPTKTVDGPAKTLPKTGPEHYILLMLLALVLGFGITKLRKNA